MFTTCINCNSSLGRNEVIEAFPVGRRLAFDASRGRLWVVGPHCARWNLTPLEERWEAIEECERRFRGTPLRISTDNIGLARLSEGLDLVRVGNALRPELALWRYGRTFRRRRMVARTIRSAGELGAHGVGVMGSWAAVGALASVLGPAGAVLAPAALLGAAYISVEGWKRSRVARLPKQYGPPIEVQRLHLRQIELVGTPGSTSWSLRVPHSLGVHEFDGPRAVRAAGAVLAAINRQGAEEWEVRAAVRRLEAAGDPEQYFSVVTQGDPKLETRRLFPAKLLRRDEPVAQAAGAAVRFAQLDAVQLAALEMAAHEEAERRAFEGELADLEAAWREAEEIASIADNLLLPAGIEEWIDRQRARLRRDAGGGEGRGGMPG